MAWPFAIIALISGSALGFEPQTAYVSIGFPVPPARVVVRDSQGNRDGVDPLKPVSSVGEGSTLCEIPNSQIMQGNISSDAPENLGAPQPQSDWSIDIAIETVQTYSVELTGIVDGVESLGFGGVTLLPGGSQVLPDPVEVFVEPGSRRIVSVTYAPYAKTVSVARLVTPADLIADVAIACRLGHVSPAGVCESLSRKAAAAAAARKRGNGKAAAGELKAFLNELKAQGGKHVQEPALTILREEAEALLNPPPPMPKPRKSKAVPAAKPAK
jgi:hypothetical protein